MIHVAPVEDAIVHDLVGDCPCEPRYEVVDDGMIAVHNSIDGLDWPMNWGVWDD